MKGKCQIDKREEDKIRLLNNLERNIWLNSISNWSIFTFVGLELFIKEMIRSWIVILYTEFTFISIGLIVYLMINLKNRYSELTFTEFNVLWSTQSIHSSHEIIEPITDAISTMTVLTPLRIVFTQHFLHEEYITETTV